MVHNWDERLEFLINVRKDWCNQDYILFLIQKVWKIKSSVNVVDFGCGYGYICDLFMPLLPKGSTYTGIDNSKELLQAAEKHLSHYKFKINLLYEDLETYEHKAEFDIAISQAVLRHIPQPFRILEKMKNSVVENGIVICMEGDRPIEDAGFYSSNIDYRELEQSALYQKMWSYEYNNGGRDYRTGIKIPQYMQEIGLKEVGIRMNDSVKFINPKAEGYNEKFNAFIDSKGYVDILNRGDNDNFIHNIGLTKHEQKIYIDNNKKIAEAVISNKGKGYLVQTPCILISYGRK